MDKKTSTNIINLNFNSVIAFTENISFYFPKEKYTDAISRLEFLKTEINQSVSPFLKTDDIVNYCYPIRDSIIDFSPEISKQLSAYWNSHVDMMKKINQIGVNTNLDTIDKTKITQMNNLTKLHFKSMESFIKDTQNQSNLFALFYFHVIRVDTFEDSIKNPLKKLLEKYELNQKYDVEEIFSVKQKVKRKDNRYITDIRAVRNFLAHFQFEILDNQDEWKIHFKSGDSPKDKIIFDETFSKEQLVEFLNNSNILYQSQFMLTLLLSGITHFKAFAKEPLLVHQLSI